MTELAGASAGALSGIRVLDLTRVLAGPLCTQTLADLGAAVWKVEPPHGDDTRHWGPPFVGDDATYFLAANRGKRSIAVDLKHAAGAALVADLAAQADVVVENFKVGDLARYGLSYDDVRDRNPQVVYVSITGYGHTGPRASEPGYDLVMQAMTGLLSMTGPQDGEPARVGVALIDVLTGLQATIAVLAALRERDATGAGRHIDLSLFDVGLASLVNVGQSTLVTGAAPQRWGSAHPSIVPYQSFPTADGHLVVAVGNDGQFRRFCEALGRPGLATDARFATNPDRVAHRTELIELLTAVLRSETTEVWLDRLTAVDVPVAPVHDVAGALDDPQVRARDLRWPSPHPADPSLQLLGNPLGEQATSARGSAPPQLGADTRAVLAEVLGLSHARIDELVADGTLIDSRRAGSEG